MKSPPPFLSHSPEETRRFGAAIGALLAAGDLVALEGDLGAGKTCLVRGLARGMGLDERAVNSPSFTNVQEYWPAAGEGTVLVHVDAWRTAAVETLGLEEARAGAAVAVEWPARFPGLPEGRLTLRLTHVDETTRQLECLPGPGWEARAPALAAALAAARVPQP